MNVKKYNKAIGAIVGGVVGIALAALGVTDSAAVPETYAPVVELGTMLVTTLVGVVLSPKNAD